MGLFDNVTDALNRGTAAAGRTGRAALLRRQLNELSRQRYELMAQLGESLYDVVVADSRLRTGREPLFDGIASLEERRREIEQHIAQIEQETWEAQRAATSYSCPRCGMRVSGSQGFCGGCGMPVAEIVAQHSDDAVMVDAVVSSANVCVSCGFPLEDGDVFCMACGTRQPA